MCMFCIPPIVGRRRVLAGLSGLVAAAAIKPAWADKAPASNAATPEAALRRLQEGNDRYVANAPIDRDFVAGRVARTFGQSPFASVLGCSDSRVAPEFAFDQSPGVLFVVRVAGNFLTEEGLASLEYGAAVLGTKLIMVLGHTGCGAVKATIERIKDNKGFPGHIDSLTRAMEAAISPVVKIGGPNLMLRAVEANVRVIVRHLAEARPVVSDLVGQKRLKVVGGVYDLATGRVTLLPS